MSYTLDTPLALLKTRADELVNLQVFDGLAGRSPRAFRFLADEDASKFELVWSIEQAERLYPFFWRELELLKLEAGAIVKSEFFYTMPKDIRVGLERCHCLTLAVLRVVVCEARTFALVREAAKRGADDKSKRTLQMAV